MPNRVLRDWTYSDLIDKVSFQAEVLFTRLIMKADDFGSYYAKPKLINGNCFPLKDIRESDISRWLQELASAGLIVFYTAENKEFLHIINFNQRLRSMKKSFPQIPDNVLNEHLRASCQRVDSELTASCPPEIETETEGETETEDVVVPTQPKSKSYKLFTKDDFKNSISEYADNFEKQMLNKFYSYWTEPSASGKMRFQLEKTWETHRRLLNWKSREIAPATDNATKIKRKRL